MLQIVSNYFRVQRWHTCGIFCLQRWHWVKIEATCQNLNQVSFLVHTHSTNHPDRTDPLSYATNENRVGSIRLPVTSGTNHNVFLDLKHRGRHGPRKPPRRKPPIARGVAKPNAVRVLRWQRRPQQRSRIGTGAQTPRCGRCHRAYRLKFKSQFSKVSVSL